MVKQELIANLKATKKSIERWGEAHSDFVLFSEYKFVFDRFQALKFNIQIDFPALHAHLPPRQQEQAEKKANDNQKVVSLANAKRLLSDIDYCLDFLAELPDVEATTVTINREGVFFAGQQFDAFMRLKEILGNAKQKIDIIDNYLNEDVLALLSTKQTDVIVDILTENTSSAVNAAAKSFNKQYGGLSIRRSQAFHDRFVIIDQIDVYHFGASFKDLGNRGFMFSRIEEPKIIQSLQSRFKSEWSSALVVI